ncbi:tetratricopeptide repeat protein [Streptosporangiaceae bacterium NEAU-GS5]|nr:tetratricopeptide repeat protein [Streptosporangiaceae bacterium NEAU-GS5]
MNLVDIGKARRMLKEGNLEQAKVAYSALLDDPSNRAEAYYGLGVVHFKGRDLETASQWFTKSIEANYRSDNSLYYLGEIAAARGDRDAAVVLFARALVLNPRHVGGLKRLAQFAPAVAGTNARAGHAPLPQSRNSPTPTARSSSSLRPPHPPSSPNAIIGIAENVRRQAVPWNGQAASKESLVLRIAVIDNSGHPKRTIGVEIRGFRVTGNVDNGDWVEVEKMDGRGRVKALRNLTNGMRIASRLW